jgi:hypothetical protein
MAIKPVGAEALQDIYALFQQLTEPPALTVA